MDIGQGGPAKTAFSKQAEQQSCDIEFLGQCACCGLSSCNGEECMFCGERVSQEVVFENGQDCKRVKVSTHSAHTQVETLRTSLPPQLVCESVREPNSSFSSIQRSHVEQAHQTRVAEQAQGSRRNGARQLDNSSDQSTLVRDFRHHGQEPCQHAESETTGVENCKSEEGRAHVVHAGSWDESQRELHHRPADEPCRGRDSQGFRTHGNGVDGLWEAWQPELPGGPGEPSILCDMGHRHSQRVRHHMLAPAKVCSVGATRTQCSEGSDSQEESCKVTFRSFEHRKLRDAGCLPLRAFESSHGSCGEVEGGRGAQEGIGEADADSASEGESTRGREDRVESHRGTPQESEGDLSEPTERLHELSSESALLLSRTWHVQRNPLSCDWQNLVQSKRPFLMELACYSDSVLGQEVERRFGKGSVVRVSEWNGGNLETEAGRAFAIRMVQRCRPVHLWISCECGPFCPLQHLNQRTPEQRERLRLKQEAAVRQYEGALLVAEAAWKIHTEVHWELSERTEAWKLKCIQDYESRHELKKVVCNGCTVGLRTRDQKLALCKAWCVATKNPNLLQHLNLRCQKNHPKGKCERGEAAHAARYTIPFAKKVIDALSMSESWCRTARELQAGDVPEEEAKAAEGEEERAPEGEVAEEISAEERSEIEAKLQKIHRNTGHGSLKNLVKALEDRGAAKKVIQVAREWSCPVCQHRKRRDPRKFATLEDIPKKWERLQVDMATWVHPRSKRKYHILLMLDEGTRFRVARVLAEGKGNTTKWLDIKKAMEESWFGAFGRPSMLRVDPAGPWMSEDADQYCAERDIELAPIPGEAHWQLSLIEGAINSLKGMLTKLSEEFPEAEVSELVARSTWVCNTEELYKGYSPIQQVLGRAPECLMIPTKGPSVKTSGKMVGSEKMCWSDVGQAKHLQRNKQKDDSREPRGWAPENTRPSCPVTLCTTGEIRCHWRRGPRRMWEDS